MVLSNPYCVGVLRPQHLFSDGQGALVEGLRFLVFALSPVEDCQVVEQVRGVGMIDPVPFFSNRERVS